MHTVRVWTNRAKGKHTLEFQGVTEFSGDKDSAHVTIVQRMQDSGNVRETTVMGVKRVEVHGPELLTEKKGDKDAG